MLSFLLFNLHNQFDSRFGGKKLVKYVPSASEDLPPHFQNPVFLQVLNCIEDKAENLQSSNLPDIRNVRGVFETYYGTG